MNKLLPIYKWISLFAILLAFAHPILAEKQVPEPTNFLVNDYAGLFNRSQVEALGKKLRDYVGETSTQIVVVTEESLEGDDAFSYVQRLATKWGIGGGENSNGVLVYVSKQDRQVRIQTGYGTEGFLPDVTAKRIIEGIMVPAFRSGNYYQGIDRATDAIMDLGRGEYAGDGFGEPIEGLPGWAIILLFILFMVLVSWINQRTDDDGGYYRGGRYDMPDRRHRRRGGSIIIPGGGFGRGTGSSGGGGSGGFGGGGFGGFGGGGFGGGGAGGSW